MKFFVSVLLGISLLLNSLFITGCGAAATPAEETKQEAAKPAEVKKEAAPAKETVEVAKPAEVVKEAKPAAVEPVKEAKVEAATKTPAAAQVAVDPEKVVVTVNGTVIREKEVSAECDKRVAAQVAQMAAMGWPADEESKKMMREQVRDNVLQMLTEKALINQQLKLNKVEVADKDVDTRFLEILKDADKTPEQAEEDLKKQNRSVAEFKEQLFWHVAIEKLYGAISKEKPVTEEEAKTFYDANPQYFQEPEQVRASHILIKTEGMDDTQKAEAKKKIEDILKRARNGEDFAELAKTYTEDSGSKDTGGEYTFPKGKMVPEFETAAFALEVGKISDVVETQFGYHIIKLSEKIPAKTWAFDEIKPKLITKLKQQKVGQFWQQFSGDMEKNAKIEWSPEEQARKAQKEKERAEQMQQMQSQQPEQAAEGQVIPPQPEEEN